MKLSDWLVEKNMRVADLARRMNITHCIVLRWCKGTIPRPKYMRAIFEITEGVVSPKDFYSDFQKEEK